MLERSMVYCHDEKIWLCAENCNSSHHKKLYKVEIEALKWKAFKSDDDILNNSNNAIQVTNSFAGPFQMAGNHVQNVSQ